MQLRQLEYLDAIIRFGTIRKAARQLFVSEASISQAIRDLEAELKLPLFDRKGRSLRITVEGEHLLPAIRKVLFAVHDLERSTEEVRDIAHGWIRLGAVPSSAVSLVPRIVTHWRELFPDASLDVHERGSYELVEEVRTGALDIAIVVRSAQVAPKTTNDDLALIPLFSTQLLAVIARTHRLAMKPTVTVQDLAHERLILYRQGYLARDLVLDVLGPEAKSNILYSTDNTESARKMVRAGFGISLLPEFLLASWDPSELNGVAILAVEGTPFALDLCCVYAPHRYRSRLLAEDLTQVMAGIQMPHLAALHPSQSYRKC